MKKFDFGSPLLGYHENIYSQNGEDGIIEHIFKKCGFKEGIVVEFGAWDGIKFSNTYNLWKNNKNIKAILIESNRKRYSKLLVNCNENVEPICKTVVNDKNSSDSLNNILINCKTDINNDNFLFMSIDVDGPDYSIWESFDVFKPKLVIIETNSGHIRYVNAGCSLHDVNALAEEKGYKLICSTGNAFFIREDLSHHFDTINVEEGYVNTKEVNILWRTLT